MEYSLRQLNRYVNLNFITTDEIINKLNIIGFEVETLIPVPLKGTTDIIKDKIFIKIPPNRDDLLNEIFFINELATIFLFDLYQIWGKLKKNYFFLLNLKYIEFLKHEKINFLAKKNFEGFFICRLEIKYNKKNKNISPLWVQEKLFLIGQKPTDTVSDILSLSKFEWGQKFDIEHIKFFSNPDNCDQIFIEGVIDNKKNSVQGFENFKFAFQRTLTLLEIISFISIIPRVEIISKKNLKLKSNRLIKLKKKSFSDFLNFENYDLKIFKKMGIKLICQTQKELYFSVPCYRNDLLREIDLIEEYSRFIGYENFLEILPSKVKVIEKQELNEIKLFFLNYSFNEILTNPLSRFYLKNDRGVTSKAKKVFIQNPLNLEENSLRSELLPKVIDIFSQNLLEGFETKNFFEIGRIFKIINNKIVENDALAGIFQLEKTKKSKRPSSEWFLAKGVVEKCLKILGYEKIRIEQLLDHSFFYFKKGKSILIKDKKQNIIGRFGEIDLKFEKNFNSKFSTYIFEFNFGLFPNNKKGSTIRTYKEQSKYPSVIKDLSFSVARNFKFVGLKNQILKIAKNLKRIEFFDIYFPENSEEFIKIGIRFEFQSMTATLTTEFIDEQIKNIENLLSFYVKDIKEK